MFGFWWNSKRREREEGKMFCIVGLGNPEKKYEKFLKYPYPFFKAADNIIVK